VGGAKDLGPTKKSGSMPGKENHPVQLMEMTATDEGGSLIGTGGPRREVESFCEGAQLFLFTTGRGHLRDTGEKDHRSGATGLGGSFALGRSDEIHVKKAVFLSGHGGHRRANNVEGRRSIGRGGWACLAGRLA